MFGQNSLGLEHNTFSLIAVHITFEPETHLNVIYAACENHTEVGSIYYDSFNGALDGYPIPILDRCFFVTGGDGDADSIKCNYLMTTHLIQHLISYAAKVCDTCESWSHDGLSTLLLRLRP